MVDIESFTTGGVGGGGARFFDSNYIISSL